VGRAERVEAKRCVPPRAHHPKSEHTLPALRAIQPHDCVARAQPPPRRPPLPCAGPTSIELSACWSPAVCTLSSRMEARSASSLPSSWLQIMEPMRILPAGWMPYSLGMTAAARARAACGVRGRTAGKDRVTQQEAPTGRHLGPCSLPACKAAGGPSPCRAQHGSPAQEHARTEYTGLRRRPRCLLWMASYLAAS
jgi:hypothetical protein